MVIWLIGLAGSGKTSIGAALHRRMKAVNPATVLLDGDQVRRIMGEDLGHSLEDRRHNGRRICNLCRVLDEQGLDVVACVLSLFHDQQAENRATLSDYFEVYLDVPMAVLEARDQKGLYSAARAGRIRDVAGIDIPFLPPPHPDLVLENALPCADFEAPAKAILAAVKRRGR
jgi:adenylylsulfate kinase